MVFELFNSPKAKKKIWMVSLESLAKMLDLFMSLAQPLPTTKKEAQREISKIKNSSIICVYVMSKELVYRDAIKLKRKERNHYTM